MTSCTGSARGGFWGFWKSLLVEFLAQKKKADFLLLAKALRQGAHVLGGGGADGKVSIERLYLSPYVEKPFNSKVIKNFVPELRSRKCFSCFGIPMFYVYMLWTFYVRFTYPYHRYITCFLSLRAKTKKIKRFLSLRISPRLFIRCEEIRHHTKKPNRTETNLTEPNQK